jgi:ABC-2 type transport system permease protein
MNLKTIRGYIRVVGSAFELTLYQNLTDAFVLFGIIVQPMIVAVLGLWMLRDQGGDYAIFVVIGSGMTGLWSSLLFISGNSITRERWTGTLELLVGQPTPIQVIIFGKNLANVLQSLLSMIASYLLAALLFGLRLEIGNPGLFIVSILFTVISFVSFGLLIAPIFVLNPGVQRWQNAMEFPVYILSGFLFPIALLPGWSTPLSYLLAPYWSAQALHGSSSGGATPDEIGFNILMMIVCSAVYLLLSRIIFRAMLKKARVDATLGMQ